MCRLRLVALLAAVLTTLSATHFAFAQSALEQVESRLEGAGAAASDDEPEPGSGYLGLVPDEKTPPPRGVRIEEVRQSAPAQTAGLRANDIIIAIDDTAITSVADLDEVLARSTAGQRLRVTVQRDGRTESMNVTLGKRPSATATDSPPVAPTTDTPPTTPAPDSSATSPPLTRPSTSPLLPPANRSFPSDSNLPRSAATPADSATPTDPTAPSDPTAPTTPETDDAAAPIERSGRPSLAPPSNRSTAPDAGPPADERLGLDVPSVGLPAVDDNPEGSTGGLPEPADGRGRASLGVTVVPVTQRLRETYGLGSVRQGALITAVRPGSAAEAAGLPVGAVIVRFENRQINSADDLVEAVSDSRAGQEVEITFWQGDEVRRLPVRLAAVGVAAMPTLPPAAPPRPSPEPAGSDDPRPSGVRPAPLVPSDRPLLSRVERTIDTLAQRPSTVYDPSEMAALRQQVIELTQQVQALGERVRALEGASGAAPSGRDSLPDAFAPSSPLPSTTVPGTAVPTSPETRVPGTTAPGAALPGNATPLVPDQPRSGATTPLVVPTP